MFFLVDKYSSLSYIKLINKLRKRLSSLRYLIMSVFILASFPSPLNFLKKVAATLCFSFLLPTFLTPLCNCHQKFTVQLKAPAKFKGIFHPRFLQCWLFLPTFCLFEEKIFLEGKTKTSSLGSCHLEPFWFSDIFFFLSTFFIDTFLFLPTTYVPQCSTQRHLFFVFILASFQLLTHFQSSCLD